MIDTRKFIDDNGIEIIVHFDDMEYSYLSHDNEERMRVYECRGYDANGRQYSGIATFICGELDSIDEIERL